MPIKLPENIQLFEASWEICNKAGGIHTVLTTKLASAKNYFPHGYLPVGPYLSNQETSFKEAPIPANFKGLATALEKKGVTIHFGKWLIEGEPDIILLGWEGLIGKLDGYKTQFWQDYQLDTLGTSFYDVDQPLLWSIAVGVLVQTYAELNPNPILLQAHEWLSAGALLILDEAKLPNVSSVFTTHATVLGRALSSTGTLIYNQLDTLNPENEARRCGVLTKHQLEKLAAQKASIFTTVSQITAEEAAAFLGRKAEVVVENGIDSSQFPSFDALCQKHTQVREQLHDFMSAYFFPAYRFDLSQTHYQFTMGRGELHNKGYDLYLQSLGQLNQQLKSEKSAKTVVSLFLVPGDALRLRPEVSLQLTVFRKVQAVLSQFVPLQQRDLYQNLWLPHHQAQEIELLPLKDREQLHQLLSHIPSSATPSLSPFDLRNGDNDNFIQTAKQNGLNNTAEDRVKVLYFPIYFDGFDGIFNLSLYDIISGCDLGIFPSLYEPWGYTPMESLAMGVPALTSNLAGFGRAIMGSYKTLPSSVLLLDRSTGDREKEAAELTQHLLQALNETDRQAMLRRMSAYMTVQAYDWHQLYLNYLHAYQLAVKS